MAAENELPVAKDASGLDDEAGLLEGLTDSSVPGALTGFDARMVKRAGYWFLCDGVLEPAPGSA
jgi:hypothetical protein